MQKQRQWMIEQQLDKPRRKRRKTVPLANGNGVFGQHKGNDQEGSSSTFSQATEIRSYKIMWRF